MRDGRDLGTRGERERERAVCARERRSGVWCILDHHASSLPGGHLEQQSGQGLSPNFFGDQGVGGSFSDDR